ncbi:MULTISPECIES: CidA/LrgA family protein [unclassified Viridibacillus]|uniref:CidA/LrgA family protein n=1 Tax=unclassified Viridibacillus TaxID=2617942 RepID=UPI001FEF0A62|nr:CidA/LrgA family protein [Viridibacillus sp. FSL H8-0123]
MQSKIGNYKLVKHKTSNYKIVIKKLEVKEPEVSEIVENEPGIKEPEVNESEISEIAEQKIEVKDYSTTQVDSTQLKQKYSEKINTVKRKSIKSMRIILQMVVLYIFSFVGTTIVNLLGVKFPGSIVGLLILLALLLSKIMPVALIEDGAGFMLAILPLFFVPATVGVIKHPELLSLNGILLLLTVIASTIFTIIFSGKICKYLEGKERVGSKEMKEGVK